MVRTRHWRRVFTLLIGSAILGAAFTAGAQDADSTADVEATAAVEPAQSTSTPTATATPTATTAATATSSASRTPTLAATLASGFTTYTVRPGENLFRIALRFGLSVSTLAADNGIVNPALIYSGQQLRIRGAGSGPTATPRPPATPTQTPVPGSTTTITVQAGDTLNRIAIRYRTTIAELVRLNSIRNPNLIFTGQTLLIPSEGSATVTPTRTTSSDGATAEATDSAALPDVSFAFGVEAFLTGADAANVGTRISDLGAAWVKVEIDWRDFEPVQGEINFEALDLIVATLEAQGVDILASVSTSPDWARTSRDEDGPPDAFADYATFVGAVAGRYAGRIAAYEIWNEPNLRREWNSSVHPIGAGEYMDLLEAAYNEIKGTDPDALVISAGLAPTGFNDGVNARNDRLYLDLMYENGLAQFSDAVGAHLGGWANPPDARCCTAPNGVLTHYEDRSFYFLDTLTDYRTIMVENGDAATPIWVTKFGWGTSADMAAPSSTYIFVTYTDLAEQAIYTPRAVELGEELGYVETMILYNLNSCQADPTSLEGCYYSLIAPDGQPRPVYDAVKALAAPPPSGEGDAVPLGETTETPDAMTEAAPAEATEALTDFGGGMEATPETMTDMSAAPEATAEATP